MKTTDVTRHYQMTLEVMGVRDLGKGTRAVLAVLLFSSSHLTPRTEATILWVMRLTMGGAGRMRLPAASWSRIVTVAVVTSPRTASTGSSGPRTRENDSCHSRSSLDRISTLKKMWSTPSPRTEQRVKVLISDPLKTVQVGTAEASCWNMPFLLGGLLSMQWLLITLAPSPVRDQFYRWNSTHGGGSVLQIYYSTHEN